MTDLESSEDSYETYLQWKQCRSFSKSEEGDNTPLQEEKFPALKSVKSLVEEGMYQMEEGKLAAGSELFLEAVSLLCDRGLLEEDKPIQIQVLKHSCRANLMLGKTLLALSEGK